MSVTGTVTGDDAAPRPCTTTCTEEPDSNVGTHRPDLSRRDIQQRRRHAVEQRRLRAGESRSVHHDHFAGRDCSRQIARRIRHRVHRNTRRYRRQHAHRVASRVRYINVAAGIRRHSPRLVQLRIQRQSAVARSNSKNRCPRSSSSPSRRHAAHPPVARIGDVQISCAIHRDSPRIVQRASRVHRRDRSLRIDAPDLIVPRVRHVDVARSHPPPPRAVVSSAPVSPGPPSPPYPGVPVPASVLIVPSGVSLRTALSSVSAM